MKYLRQKNKPLFVWNTPLKEAYSQKQLRTLMASYSVDGTFTN